MAIVYRGIATHLIKKAGFSRNTAQTGAVTLIQRFGNALNLNIHFHMLFLDGVYVERPDGSLRCRWVTAPTSAELARLTQTLALRIGRDLERQGGMRRKGFRRKAAYTSYTPDFMAKRSWQDSPGILRSIHLAAGSQAINTSLRAALGLIA